MKTSWPLSIVIALLLAACPKENRPPVINLDGIETIYVDPNTTYRLNLASFGSDPDGDQLRWRGISSESGLLTITVAENGLTTIVTKEQDGGQNLLLVLSDEQLMAALKEVRIVVRNTLEVEGSRHVSFCGYDFTVREQLRYLTTPGDNFFDAGDQAVWVDDQGLHLTARAVGVDWYCSEVIANASLGYGTYTIVTKGRLDLLPENLVLGMFTWDWQGQLQAYREFDFEFTRWGDPNEFTNAQFAIQPCAQCPDPAGHCQRFRVDLDDQSQEMTHYLVWQPGFCEWRSYYGNYAGLGRPPREALASHWRYQGELTKTPGTENWRFNLWHYNGSQSLASAGITLEEMPETEMVIASFGWQAHDIFE
jgi:hypothetical protein